MDAREEILNPQITFFLGITSVRIIQFLAKPGSIFWMSSACCSIFKVMLTCTSKQTELVLNGVVQKSFFLKLKPQYELWTKKYSQTSLPTAYCENKSFHIPKARQSTLIMPCFSYCILYFPRYCLCLLTLCLMIPVVLSKLPTQLLYPNSSNQGYTKKCPRKDAVIVCCGLNSLQLRMLLIKNHLFFYLNKLHS